MGKRFDPAYFDPAYFDTTEYTDVLDIDLGDSVPWRMFACRETARIFHDAPARVLFDLVGFSGAEAARLYNDAVPMRTLFDNVGGH